MDRYLDALVGKTAEVLCEGYSEEDGCFFCRSYAESPEIDGRILFSAPEDVTAGAFVKVKITGSRAGEPLGELCSPEETTV
jgi:ribosomal protein S12 methylthiotransferase